MQIESPGPAAPPRSRRGGRSQRVLPRKKQVRVALGIFVLALAARTAYALFIADRGPPVNDAVEYLGLAHSLVERHSFCWNGYCSHRPPLYPFFLAALLYMPGKAVVWITAVQILLGSVTCLLTWRLAERVERHSGAALGAGLLSACWYGLLVMPPAILSETLFTFLLTLGLLPLARTELRLKHSLCSGAVLGLAALCRASLLLFPLFFLLQALVSRCRGSKTLVPWLGFTLAFLLVLTPWTIRNYRLHGALVPINIQAGEVFQGAHNAHARGGWVAPDGPDRDQAPLTEIQRDRARLRAGWQYLKSLAPGQVLALEVQKIRNLLFPAIVTYDVTFMILAPFCLIGMAARLRSNSILYYVAASVLLSALLFYGSPRFRGPLSPVIICFGVAGVRTLLQKKPHAPLYRGAAALWVVANAVVFCLEAIVDFDFGLF